MPNDPARELGSLIGQRDRLERKREKLTAALDEAVAVLAELDEKILEYDGVNMTASAGAAAGTAKANSTGETN